MAEARPALRSLAGLRVLVTRPRHQSDGLVSLIEARGGVAIRFPVIEIVPARDPEAIRSAREALTALGDDGVAIFVSPNAVEHGLALAGGPANFRGRIVAVGESTAAALEAAGFRSVLRPSEGASSEALLALPELAAKALAGCRIVIVRGEGGRPLLGDTLSRRGARVAYAQVYRRERPPGGASEVAEVAELGAAGGIDAVVVTSVEGFDNLFDLIGEARGSWLREAGYVVVSQRLAEHARSLGISQAPLVAAGADDDALLEALARWRGLHPGSGS